MGGKVKNVILKGNAGQRAALIGVCGRSLKLTIGTAPVELSQAW